MSEGTWQEGYTARRGPLYRDPENGIVMGVCAGIAKRFELSLFWTRAVALFALWIFTLPTLIVYFSLGMLMREKPLAYRGPESERDFWRRAARRARQWKDDYEAS